MAQLASFDMELAELAEEQARILAKRAKVLEEELAAQKVRLAQSAGPEELAGFALELSRREEVAASVYFIQGDPGSPVKIGRTHDLNARFASLQTANPMTLRWLLTLRGGAQLEKWLHAAFDSDRTRGEWFVASHRLLKFVEITAKELGQ